MYKKLLTVIISVLIVCSTLIIPQQASASNVIGSAVSKRIGTTNVSVSLRSLQTGNVIYELKANTPMKPASTLKLLTGSAALATLGENYRFATEFYIDGKVVGNVLNGDIYIKGSGDPTLQTSDFLQFAKALKSEGIRKINGQLYGDDTAFSGPTLTPGIVAKEETYYFAARTSALTMSPNADYDASTLIVTANATKAGRAPSYSVTPNLSGMKIKNNAKTVAKGNKNTLTIKRRYNSDEIIIAGNIPVGSSLKEWVTFKDPTINTLASAKLTLEGTGLKFASQPTIKRKAVSNDAKLIYTKQSLTLKALYPTFVKLSNNSIADILIKAMGREVYGVGDTTTGLRVVREYGESIDLSMDEWTLHDGSGMSHTNKVSANEQTLLLHNIIASDIYPTFYRGLPIGGVDGRLVGGSLRKRFNSVDLSNRVVAKTGSITGVYTLAGYVTAKSGRTFAFSVMTSDKSTAAVKGIDAVVESIIKNY